MWVGLALTYFSEITWRQDPKTPYARARLLELMLDIMGDISHVLATKWQDLLRAIHGSAPPSAGLLIRGCTPCRSSSSFLCGCLRSGPVLS